MEKPDRDYTHAKRAEEEYRYLIMTYPDSKLVPEAKQRLLEVQEVLAEREYLIGHFYFMRESWPAAIARLKSAVDTYPLYSGADDALFELGSAYEREADLLRASKLPEASKGKLIKQYNDEAAQAYGRIITRYPLQSRANEAKARLNAMKRPIPRVTEAAIAQNRAEIASRGSMGMMGKMMSNFHKHPEVYEATKIGEPTLVDPKQASAPEMVRAAGASILAGARGGNNKATVERIDANGTLAENAPVPRSETAGAGNNSASAGAAADGTQPAAGGSANGTPAAANAKSDIPELQNDLPQPAGEAASSSTAQAPTATQMPSQSNDATPPTQVNDAAASSQGDSASASNNTQQAAAIDPNKESSSKKSKKHKWNPF
jgi:outer membrane protein assembly factor BamD